MDGRSRTRYGGSTECQNDRTDGGVIKQRYSMIEIGDLLNKVK